MKQLSSILIKPSGPDCNLNCTYCFYLDKAGLFPNDKVHRMSEEVLEELIRQAMQQSPQNISMSWQGGEPTLMGLDFFKKVVELEQKYGNGKIVGNGFQTNGYLLNEEWADFLAQWQFLVGFSIDGPQHIHDHYRVLRNGQGTWKRLHKNLKMLLKRGVEVNTLTCVTDYSSQFAKDIYNYHKSNGIHWMQFIPILEVDKNDPTKAADFSCSAEQFGEFLCEMFDLWRADFTPYGMPTTSVRHFESWFFRYVGMPAPECTMMKKCGPYVVVEHNGNIYGCDFFVDEAGYLGNITKGQTLIGALNSKKQTQFGNMKALLPKGCKECEWLKYCYGGCLKDRLHDPKSNGQNHFCKSFKMFFEHADGFMKKMAEDWKENNPDYLKQQGGNIDL